MRLSASSVSVFRGPSLHAAVPVVHVGFDGRHAPNEQFVDELYRRLPGLRESFTSCPGGSAGEEHDSWGHLFEHACLEVQNRAGFELTCLRREGGAAGRRDKAAVAWEDEDVAVGAAGLILDLFRSLARRRTGSFDFEAAQAEFLQMASRRAMSVQDRALVGAARARGVPVIRIAQRVFQLGQGRHRQWISATKTSRTSILGNDLAANKDYSRRLLGALGLPIPRYRRVWSVRDAVQAARDLGFPVVVKPNFGNMGGGVTVGVRDVEQVRVAYRSARALGRSVIIEELVPGNDYRLLVVDGRLEAAAQRIPAHVRGDGVHQIEELVQAVNADPRRGEGQHQRWSRFELDERALAVLEDAGYAPDAVPPAGEIVYLRRNANTSDGGTAVDVTDRVHPDNREIAERGARAVGLDVAGVDLLTTDIAQSIWETNGCVCEINSRPGLRKHLWPAEGTPRDVIRPILEMLFPGEGAGRVPVAAVVGDARGEEAARRLAALLGDAGLVVGLATSRGVTIGGRPVGRARGAGPAAARMIFLDPAVEAAVFAMTPEDVARHGLGYDVSDVSTVLDTDRFDAALTAEVAELVNATTRTAIDVGPGREREGPERVARAMARNLGVEVETRRGRPPKDAS